MAEKVELSVKSQLKKVIEELEGITKAAQGVSASLNEMAKETGDTTKKQLKGIELFLSKIRGLSSRAAKQMKDDFRSLASLNAIGQSLALSNQFKGSVREAVNLSDTIRKLGGTFGIASKDFANFQSKMIKGLGEIGMDSDVAANTLKGLADTPVRGAENVLGYSKGAGQLASISNSKGQEGDIAKGIAKVIQARGGNPNDMKQVSAVMEDLRRVFNQTGKGPTETLQAMQQLFASMPKDMRKMIGTRGLANLAATSQIAGPNSTKFLEELLGKSPIARKAMEAQGFKGVVTDKGLDVDKFKKASQGVLSRVGGDPRLAAQTLGLSEDAAEGFVRLTESLGLVKKAQEGIEKSTGDLNTQYRSSMGLGEAFRANINRIKKIVADPLSSVTQGLTDMMSGASGSNAGAAGVVAGGGVLAALLAGGGMRGLGKGLGIGGMAKAAGIEAATGRQVQPVYVTNAAEIGGGGMGGGMGGKMALGGLAVTAGIAASAAASQIVEPGGLGAAASGVGMQGLGEKLDQLEKIVGEWTAGLTGMHSSGGRPAVKVELNKRDLKEVKQPSRGASN